jgi:hypothetical protein
VQAQRHNEAGELEERTEEDIMLTTERRVSLPKSTLRGEPSRDAAPSTPAGITGATEILYRVDRPTAAAASTIRLNATRPQWLSDAGGSVRRFLSPDTPWEASPLSALTQSHAQDAEDVYAFVHYFFGRGGGSFLEMGALDGVLHSNTVAMERELGWKGVLIEASPNSYARLVVNRPDQVCPVIEVTCPHAVAW